MLRHCQEHLCEYAREHGYIGKSTNEEEKYLINISDKDAYSVEHFINYTKQPLLKVYSWRHLIKWKIWREHAKINLKINLSKFTITIGLISMLLKKYILLNLILNWRKFCINLGLKENRKKALLLILEIKLEQLKHLDYFFLGINLLIHFYASVNSHS